MKGVRLFLMAMVGVMGIACRLQATPSPMPTLVMGSQVIQSDAPFVTRGRVTYAPIRDIARATRSQLQYDRHLDAFQMTCPSPPITIMVLVNDTQGFVNTKPHVLSAQTLFIDSQLYVPLHEVIKWMGLGISQVGSRWVITPSPPPSPPASALSSPPLSRISVASITPSAPRSVAVAHVPSTHATTRHAGVTVVSGNTPLVTDQRPLYPTPSGMSLHSVSSLQPVPIRVSPGLISMNQTWWIALDPWGDKSQRTPTQWVGRWGTQSLKWPVTTAIPSGNGAVVWAHDGSYWIAVAHLAKEMGLGWHVQQNRIEWTQSIDRIRWGNGDPPSLKIMGQLPIKNARLQPTPTGFQLVIPQATTRLRQWDGVTGDITRIQIRSTQNQVILTAVTRGNLDYETCRPLSNGCELKPIAQLTRVTERPTDNQMATANQWVIELEGKGLGRPHIWRHQKRMVIDFHDTRIRCAVPTSPIRTGLLSPYTGIRLGQFSTAPPVARLVLDGMVSANVTWHPTAWGGRLQGDMGGGEGRGRTPLARPTERPAPLPSPAPLHPTLPLRHLVVVIDPGHGGSDPGGIAANGMYEKELTIQLSRRLKTELERLGGKVVMCRQNDENPSLQDRCDVAHRTKGDILISVHINSFFHPFASGTETYYYKPTDKPLSYLIHQRMTGVLGFRDNGLKRARMYVLRNTTMPATLIEPGFITNPMEFDRLSRADVQQKLAQAITQGIVDYVTLPKEKRVSE